MVEFSTSFEAAWEGFLALDSLQLVGDSSQLEWTHGRAQLLLFLVRLEDKDALQYAARVGERIASIPGVEVTPEAHLHMTVKVAGFQVIKRTRDDDIVRQDVPRIATSARDLLIKEPAFEARLGPVSGFASVVFLEVWDGGRLSQLNDRLRELMPQLAKSQIDGAGFLPHLSIARFTSNDSLAELKSALAELRAEGPGPTFPVRRVEFTKAWLAEEMSGFETLASYPLAAS
ncbi:MAG: 2'-5' RNA ligase family protein [Chloroflexi bacterium]|nr:2'-5' RNA ligase family protein [Chloroflexota bacterium]